MTSAATPHDQHARREPGRRSASMDGISPAVSDGTDTTPWQKGEVELQQRVGVAERMREIGSRVVRTFMPDQHRAFFAQLPFVAFGAVDDDGDVWATMLAGRPGFMQSP